MGELTSSGKTVRFVGNGAHHGRGTGRQCWTRVRMTPQSRQSSGWTPLSSATMEPRGRDVIGQDGRGRTGRSRQSDTSDEPGTVKNRWMHSRKIEKHRARRNTPLIRAPESEKRLGTASVDSQSRRTCCELSRGEDSWTDRGSLLAASRTSTWPSTKPWRVGWRTGRRPGR